MLVALGCVRRAAQGIPVIDAANLAQTVQQVINDITKINNQVQQITQLQAQLSSINGMRNLGNVFNSPLLRNYVPPQAFKRGQRGAHLRLRRPRRAPPRRCATPAWSTTAWTLPAPRAPTARRRWPSPTSTRACCRTR